MTPRERLLRTLAHEEPDRVPLHPQCGDEILDRMIRSTDLPPEVQDRFLRGDVDAVTFKGRIDDPIFQRYHPNTPPQAWIDDWGSGTLRHRDSGEFLLTRELYHPLAGMERPEDLDDYPFPDMTEPWRSQDIAAAVGASHAAHRPVIGQMSQTLIETCYQMRGMEELFCDLYDRPDFVERLFNRITEQRCIQARFFAESGVDVLRIGDDIATQEDVLVSPQVYRQLLKPRHAKIIAAAREVRPDIPVLYHSDGNIARFIPDMIEIGITAINPIQPEAIDPAWVKKTYGQYLTIWGAVATQRVIAFGDEADVDAEVRRRMATLAPGGGYVAGFINVAWSPRARRNVLHYMRRLHEYAVYR